MFRSPANGYEVSQKVEYLGRGIYFFGLLILILALAAVPVLFILLATGAMDDGLVYVPFIVLGGGFVEFASAYVLHLFVLGEAQKVEAAYRYSNAALSKVAEKENPSNVPQEVSNMDSTKERNQNSEKKNVSVKDFSDIPEDVGGSTVLMEDPLFDVVCPSCGKTCSFPNRMKGKTVDCPWCDTTFRA